MNSQKDISNQIYEDFIIKHNNICITGAAGTGKSTLLLKILELIEGSEIKINYLVLAPTGISACNISGTTIHRGFNLEKKIYGPNEKLESEILNHTTHIIIDEIGNCRFDIIDLIFRSVIKKNIQSPNSISIMVLGDWLQNGPVITKKDIEHIQLLWGSGYETGYAFYSPFWSDMNFQYYYLTEIKRVDNKDFIKNLHMIRIGNIMVS